jgi:hypothetical protein
MENFKRRRETNSTSRIEARREKMRKKALTIRKIAELE